MYRGMSRKQIYMLISVCVYTNVVISGHVRTDRFLISQDQLNANTSAPVFSGNTFPKVILCQINKPCIITLPVDSTKTSRPNVQHGHQDPGLVVDPIRVRHKAPNFSDPKHSMSSFEAMVTVMPTEKKAYQYCVQTTDEIKLNVDERCFTIQGLPANLMNMQTTSSHFNYPPTLPNNTSMSCPRNVTCHYTVEFQRYGGSCHPPRAVEPPEISIQVNIAEVKQQACRYDVVFTPSVNATGNKTVCVAINKSTVERHCFIVDVSAETASELAGPCSRIRCANGGFCDSVDRTSRCLCQPGFTDKTCDKPVECSVSFPSAITCPDKVCRVTGIAVGTQQVISNGNVVDTQKDANNGMVNIIQIQQTRNDPEICFHVSQTNCHKQGCVSVIRDNHYLPSKHLPGQFLSKNITYNCNTDHDCYLTVMTYPATNTTCADVTVNPNTTVTNHRVFPTTLNGPHCTTTVVMTGTTTPGENQQLCLQTSSDVNCIAVTVKDFEKCSTNPCKNGGTCEALLIGYTCTCNAGWTDSNCTTNIDECSPNPCVHGTCQDGISKYTCTCKAGYFGRMCETEINQCLPDPCHYGTCHDRVNNYTCKCQAGYSGRNCDTDINECSFDHCQHGTCNDGINSYTCTCFAGYTDRNCSTDINECVPDPCLHGTCVDRINNYACTCDDGFNGRYCGTDIDECSPDPCINGTCIDGINNYTCTCDAGFTGDDCGTDIDECSPDPCINGVCNDGINNYTCTCDAGFTGDDCSTDVNECDTFSCLHGVCVDGINNYTCSCDAGYDGRNCDKDINECNPDPCLHGTCVDRINNYACTCDDGFNGRNCGTDIDECSPDPCINGTCIDGINNYTCTCDAGFTGDDCGTDIDECSPDPCINGVCNDGINNYTCTCDAGFTGDDCSTDVNECDTFSCLHGVCVDGINNYTCLCDAGYDSRNCDKDIDECSTNPCINGTCIDGINNYTCTCDVGFTGDNCGTGIDYCGHSPCQNGGTCWDGIEKYVCQCDLGYTGRNCETDINECLSNPCLNCAACSDLVDSFKCTCMANFTGILCETKVLHCHQGECLNGGTCVDGTCQCHTGYRGEHCQIYIDPCYSSPCLHGSCFHHGTDFYCECPTGYTGKKCEVLINNCDRVPCLNGGACVNSLNNFTCNCLNGFTGDHCQTDIDDCNSQPCMHNGNCIDGINTFTCQCQYGYGGFMCQTVTDFCILHPCVTGTCFSSVTDYHCTCPSGYTGKTCNTTVAMAINGPDRVNITVPGGGDILMNCSVTGNPIAYHWSKIHRCGGPQETLGVLGSKLQIHHATRNDTGIYTCSASDGHGSNVTKYFDVKVNANHGEKCVFDKNATCSWKQMNNSVDMFDWTLQSGGTQSSDTGPGNDHTTGNDKGSYLYIESSSPRLQGDYASLLSERLPANHTMCLEFWYYMYGDGIGNLTINLKDSCSHKKSEVFKRTGDQGQKWIKASITIRSDLVPNDYTIKLTADVGPTFKGDTAIDDLSLIDGSCTNSQKSSNPAIVG